MATKGMDIKKIIEIATEAGVNAALNTLKKEREQRKEKYHDRRLNNTRLLLEHFRNFKQTAQEAVFDVKEIEEETALEILEELMSSAFSDFLEIRIESIKKNVARTVTMVSHISKMIEIYKTVCERSYKSEEMRRYRVIVAKYIQDEKELTTDDIAEAEHVDIRTVQRDIKIALETLSTLIFGIDGLRFK
jgi:cobalamin biosynthesis protein CbiD